MAPREDETVRLPPARPSSPARPFEVPRRAARRSSPPWLIPAAASAGLLVLAGGATVLLWPAPAPPAAPTAVTAAARAGIERFPLATEAEILASRTPDLAIRRLAPNPAVLVLDFPTLGEQARMLNRVAALVEKAGLPRDRVLDDAALAAAIRAGGTTAETFYYGHNYRASDLARFFQLADRDGVRLNAEEERLRALLRDIGWLSVGAHGAVVSIPHAGVEPWLDMRARAAMLRHELSHGEFFTNPIFETTVWRFWREMLTETERTRFRAVLAAESYDPTLEEVMANEAQAFLLNTPDERFFNPATVGMAPERVAALRAAFIAAMPPGWLRDAMGR